jgi:hypothetical protein
MITCDTSFKIKKDYARSVDGSKDNPIKQSARTGNARIVFVPGKEHTRHQLELVCVFYFMTLTSNHMMASLEKRI